MIAQNQYDVRTRLSLITQRVAAYLEKINDIQPNKDRLDLNRKSTLLDIIIIGSKMQQ